MGGHRANCPPPSVTAETRVSGLAQTQEWEPLQETSARVGKPELLINCWGLSADKSEGLKLQGDLVTVGPPQFCEIVLQELRQVPIGNTGEECPPGKGRGKGTILRSSRGTLFLTGPASEKLVHQSLTDLGEGKYSTPAHASHPVPPSEGEKKP